MILFHFSKLLEHCRFIIGGLLLFGSILALFFGSRFFFCSSFTSHLVRYLCSTFGYLCLFGSGLCTLIIER